MSLMQPLNILKTGCAASEVDIARPTSLPAQAGAGSRAQKYNPHLQQADRKKNYPKPARPA